MKTPPEEKILAQSKTTGIKCAACREKQTPHSAKDLKILNDRLNRISGQLNGIQRMVNENRYCGDVIMQLGAAERAVQSLGYMILSEHFKTCVAENVATGNTAILDEAIELVRKLK